MCEGIENWFSRAKAHVLIYNKKVLKKKKIPHNKHNFNILVNSWRLKPYLISTEYTYKNIFKMYVKYI